MNDIEKAREILKQAGYFVDNLWQVSDVMHKFECSEDEAQEVLSSALQNEATMEQIWFAIDFHGEEMNLTKKVFSHE